MAGYTQLETAIKVTAPNGTTFWTGHGWLGAILDCICGTGTTALTTASVTNTSFGVAPGDLVKIFNTATAGDDLNGNTHIQPWVSGTVPLVTQLSVRPTTAVADTGLVGIALTGTPIRTAATQVRDGLVVAGVGSVVTANCLAAAIGVGLHVGGSASSGAVTPITNANMIIAGTGAGFNIGICLRTNTAAADGVGLTTNVGVLVCPA